MADESFSIKLNKKLVEYGYESMAEEESAELEADFMAVVKEIGGHSDILVEEIFRMIEDHDSGKTVVIDDYIDRVRSAVEDQ